jgi:hypothetical protein
VHREASYEQQSSHLKSLINVRNGSKADIQACGAERQL